MQFHSRTSSDGRLRIGESPSFGYHARHCLRGVGLLPSCQLYDRTAVLLRVAEKYSGSVAERLKAPVLKTGNDVSRS